MKKENTNSKPYAVRLPGFLIDKETGLGDIIKKATVAVGIKPCGGCEQRAAMLNKWIVFHSKHK